MIMEYLRNDLVSGHVLYMGSLNEWNPVVWFEDIGDNYVSLYV